MIVWERTIINKKEAGEGPLKNLRQSLPCPQEQKGTCLTI